MIRFLQSEIGAAVSWVVASLLMAAVISPHVYQGGKALAAAAELHDWPALVEWFAASCGRAKIGRFFDRSLLFSALVLLPFLFSRIRRLRAAGGPSSPWELQPLAWPTVATQVILGCLIAGGGLVALTGGLGLAGCCVPREMSPPLGKALSKVLIPAVAAPLIEEWLFRGLLLGLWLRFAKPLPACVGTSLLFAFLHFLKPPAGTIIADPAHALAGFQLLGSILLHFSDPKFFVTDFATLFLVGMILAWTRLRTGSLWFAVGLHAGWIIAFKAFNLYFEVVESHPLHPWGIGNSPRSGLLPILSLLLTAWLCQKILSNPRINPASR